jgi:hypothetical protein
MSDIIESPEKKRITRIVWQPRSQPQKDLMDCPFAEVFFGGARGGGKTDGVLGKWAKKERIYGQHFNGIMFRRTTVSSEDAIERSKEIFLPLGGTFNEGKLRWKMPNGGRIGFAYLDTVEDANQYQGRNVTDAWIEEAGQFPDPAPIDRLFGLLRSAHGVPPQMVLTANPGGVGQGWIAQRYRLIPFPRGPQIVERARANGTRHRMAVIPSRITDNRILLERDPGYIDRLQLVGSPALVRAWLEGDWTAIEGAFFQEWSEAKHVIEPFAIPRDWLRFRSADWGSARPFSFGWWAVAGDDTVCGNRVIPRGALVRYREWYGCVAGRPNTGLKLHAEQVGRRLQELEENDDPISYGVLDPAAFAEDGGPSIAEMLARGARYHITWQPADNKRVSGRGHIGGWDQLRGRLVGLDDGRGHKRPMIYFFNTCRDAIRTIPVLQHDLTRVEDIDTESEDHAADEVRYACMSRPWVAQPVVKKLPQMFDYKPMSSRNEGADALTI